MNKHVITAIISGFLLLAFVSAIKGGEPSLGGAGLASHLQSATTTTVGPQETVTLFSDTTSCKSRVVSTTDSAVMLAFGDPTNGDVASTTLSGTVGHWQAASTTERYTSDNVGCGRVTAFGYSSSTVTVSEF